MLTQVIGKAPWSGGQFTMGMAVDTRNRLFIAAHEAVYVLEGSSLDVYLTIDDVSSALGRQGVFGFGDLDVSIDDTIYVGASIGILHSPAPHEARLWRESSPSAGVAKLGVLQTDNVAFMDRYGLWLATGADEQLIFASDQIQGASGCATEDFAVARAGVFLYQPGCLSSPLFRGNLHVASLSLLYTTDWQEPSPVHAEGFRCVTRNPGGGYYLVVEDVNHELELYYVAADAVDTRGLTWMRVTPSLSEARRGQNQALAFLFCSLAAARDGTIYLQTYDQLWKLSPP